MTGITPPSSSTDVEDYRLSHLNKGAGYDQALAQSPWDAYMTAKERAVLKHVLGKMDKNARVLDFACGTGRLTQVIGEMGFDSYGLDISPSMIEVAKSKSPKTKFVLADGSAAQNSLPPMDVITAFRFFGNAQDELRKQCLQQIVGYMKPGGYLLANNHRNPWTIRNILVRLRGQKPEETLSFWHMKELLEAAGLQIVKTYAIGFWLFRAKWHSKVAGDAQTTLEGVANSRFKAAFSPDVLFLAQKPRA